MQYSYICCVNRAKKYIDMKKILFAIALMLPLLTGCSKLEINQDNIIGTWVDDYSDHPYYAPEGGATYTFRADGKVDIHFYDVFAGEKDVRKSYLIENGELHLNPQMSDLSGDVFKIIKLTKEEMEWQRKGTTFSKGTVGSDFQHFVRK